MQQSSPGATRGVLTILVYIEMDVKAILPLLYRTQGKSGRFQLIDSERQAPGHKGIRNGT